MVDVRRIRRLLQRITDDLAFLQARRGADRTSLLADVERLAAIKYVFVTAIEGCIDVAQHLCASEGWGPPTSNADAIRALARHQALAVSLAESVASAVGFRNVLVHGYIDVDNRLVIGFLDRLDDLEGFVRAIATWTEKDSA